ncbi:carboxymuconolactone decarboxylase family protein [Hazenella sp. IB182357]|uniref:Carboxymuconolactone decarboxylase family protein n=1 Tax=Polycladospora coralii TaxID=2771432 RepID=A0A926RV56_9BACL|nr:carboxymuconolactone decarboxylase family protein [Polycladospora coralii]MBD1373813.1 carboxymuconolactone decarboxylase family protein [Polycladospora coralii]
MQEQMIEQGIMDYKEGVSKFAKHMPDVVNHYHAFTDACFQDGVIAKKTKHLIGMSLGIQSGDEYCIIYHTKNAVDCGASEQEVMEAASVCAAFGGGYAMSQVVTLLQDTMATVQKVH